MKKLKIKDLGPMYIEERRKQYEAGKDGVQRIAKTRMAETIAEGTFKEIERIMTRDFIPLWGDLRPKKIVPKLFNLFTASKEGDMANHRKVLNGFLGWCVDQEIIDFRPSFKIPKWIRRPRHVLSPDEILKLMKESAKDMVNFMFVTLGLMHGLRPSERTKIRKDDFDFELLSINLRWDTIKTKKARSLALNSECAPIYKAYFATYSSPYVFPHEFDENRHKTKGWYAFRWAKLRRCAGLFDRETGKLFDITPHDLRATAEKFAALDPKVTKIVKERSFGAKEEMQHGTYITRLEIEEMRRATEAVTSDEIGVVGLKDILNLMKVPA